MNIGVHSGLIDAKHEQRMGPAIWLYLWLLWRQTKSSGLVLGGMPLTYAEIAKRSGFAERKIRRWMDALRLFGYVKIEYRSYKMLCIQVLKSKKFNYKQASLPLTENSQSLGSTMTENGRYVRPKTVSHVTKNGQFKQSVSMREIESTTTLAMPEGIASMVPVALWLQFIKMRKQIRKPLTDGAVDLLVRQLLQFQSEGQDPIAIIEQSIMNSWAGVFPVKGNSSGKQKGKLSGTELAIHNAKVLGLAN